MSIWQPKFLFWIIFLFVYLLVIFTFFIFFIDFDGYYIARTDEGQPRPKYTINKCGTNIYTFLHHHNWILHIKQIYSSALGPKNLWNNKTNLWFKSWFWIIQWTWNTTMDPFHLISWFSSYLSVKHFTLSTTSNTHKIG